MPRDIARDEMQRLQRQGAGIVEVLPPDEYDLEHIAGAISLPLGKLTAARARELLDPERPIVVYCQDAA
jgi:rhodanese-related sulfurtransferase